MAKRYKVLPSELLKLPVDQLAVNYHIARAAVLAELEAIKDRDKEKGKTKAPQTAEEYRKSADSLSQINRLQG